MFIKRLGKLEHHSKLCIIGDMLQEHSLLLCECFKSLFNLHSFVLVDVVVFDVSCKRLIATRQVSLMGLILGGVFIVRASGKGASENSLLYTSKQSKKKVP